MLNGPLDDIQCVNDCMALFPAGYEVEFSQCVAGCYNVSTTPTGETPTGNGKLEPTKSAFGDINWQKILPVVLIGGGALWYFTKK